MPYRPPLYGIFWAHIFCKYGGWGWSELCSNVPFCRPHLEIVSVHPLGRAFCWTMRNRSTRIAEKYRFLRSLGLRGLGHMAPAEGQQQQLKTTSDVTSKFLWCCRASVWWSGKEALDVASDDPPDEALSCRRRAWDVPYSELKNYCPSFKKITCMF